MTDLGATFSAQPLARSRRRSIAAVAVWVVALTAIVGFGALGRAPASTSADAATSAGPRGSGNPSALRSAQIADSGPLVTVAPLAAVTFDVVEIRSLGVDPVALTTPAVSIEGVVHVRASEVDVALEDANAHLLDYQAIDVSDPNGGVRPLQSAVFSADLNIQGSSTGILWIVVSAVRWDGTPLGNVRRAIFIGGWVQVPREQVVEGSTQTRNDFLDRR
jgi:hypothetical protein